MASQKLRQQIIFEAARLMYSRRETEYYRAKMKAARRICQGWVKPSELPSNWEIRDAIQRFAFTLEGDSRFDRLREMRVEALYIMRLLRNFRPRLIGSTLTGHIRRGSDIDIHVFSAGSDGIQRMLELEGIESEIERKEIRKHGENRTFTHIHVRGRFDVELTVYPLDKTSYVFKSSITGKAMERATLPEFEQLLEREYPEVEMNDAIAAAENQVDCFQLYRSLLLPLECIKQSRKYHPEGEVLYHSLQVFDLACDELPYDEEFLLAALLHDVGKGIDPDDHVVAGLEALGDSITERTHWLIENHMLAHALANGTIGARARRRVMKSDSFDELELLGQCDRAGRVPGAQVPDLEDALDYIRDLGRN